MDVIIIIQARMGSSRLPGKVLMPLGNTVVLDYVIARCQQIPKVKEVIIATSTLNQDDPIEEWCQQNDVICFRGSEDDVLSRYYECSKQYKPDYVIRVTADCPFVDYHLAEDIINKMESQPTDIMDFKGELPRGLVVEMVSYNALRYMFQHGKEDRHREHVTYYAKEEKHINQFKRTLYTIPDNMKHSHLRITLDTEEDYELCKSIANHFGGDVLVPSEEVVCFLLEHPEIAQINAHIEQKPVV
ncbi:cytidylyltransferase domain-containing protein [Cytobacillus gottheilii]|uniref:cytidylyltransferase domain-containing protein n=1 Tax=Cytobacillus gottheilii TaxID=859144 RepID=UPI003CF0BD8A